MEKLFIETAHASLNKHDESLCGDSFHISRYGDRLTVVLSDGLGSGVKANILSTLTAEMLSNLMASGKISVEECIETVASTLPMCKERHLAYSTFTLAQVEGNRLRLVQYDNPDAVLLRDGKNLVYPSSVHFVGEKEIRESVVALQENDMLFLMTDGVTNAGIGKVMPDGWKREDIVKCLERWYEPDISPQRMAAQLVDAGQTLCLDSADDDITVLAMKMRGRKAVNVMIGPPSNPEEDEKILKLFFAKEGLHIISGGTTAHIVSRYLKKPVISVPDSGTEDVPAIASIEGVDLVTEGVITLQALVTLAEKYAANNRTHMDFDRSKDGVSRMASILFEQATDITIFAGQAVNEAHDLLDIDFEAKSMLIKRLIKSLGDMGKTVKLSRC